MLSTRFHKFLRDESGGYTIWSLIWFSLYVAMGGLAVDMTDAYRNQTRCSRPRTPPPCRG